VTIRRPSLPVGAYAVVERNGTILLPRWLATDRPRWTLPGGGLDHGEDPRGAAVREAFEETGYRVRLRRLLTVESFRTLVDDPDGPVDVGLAAVGHGHLLVGERGAVG
jgi:ADP-ribose pyrophosphatase YjhB (NUDIX family)